MAVVLEAFCCVTAVGVDCDGCELVCKSHIRRLSSVMTQSNNSSRLRVLSGRFLSIYSRYLQALAQEHQVSTKM